MDIVTYALCKKMAGGKGEKGDKGDKGEQGLPGRDGADGVTPNLQVGTVTTLPAGQNATVTRTGTDEDPIFSFAIPKGDTGKDGIYVGRVEDAPDHAQVVVNDDASPYDLFFENANVSYMGDTYTSLKEKSDADIEYLLREIQTQHYEGQRITATNTYQKQVKSAILKGQTLTNISKFSGSIEREPGRALSLGNNMINNNTTYMLIINFDKINDTASVKIEAGKNGVWVKDIKTVSIALGINKIIITTPSGIDMNELKITNPPTNASSIIMSNIMVIEYQEGLENLHIPYFEGMKSVKMPVLKATGKNLFNQASEIGAGSVTNIDAVKYTYDSSTNTSCVYSSGWHGGYRHYLKVIPNKTYFFYSEVTWGIHLAINCDGQRIAENIISGTDSGDDYYQSKVVSFVPTTDEIYIAYAYRTLNRNGYARNIVISDVNITSYEPYKTNILSTPEDLVMRSNGNVYDELDLITGKFTQRIDESNEVLAQEVVKTVDLNNQKVYSYDGTTHYTTSSGVEGHLAPILSIDVPTNLPALVSRQRDTIQTLSAENEALKEEVAVVDQQRESGDLELLSSNFDLDFRLMEIEFALDIPIAATFKEVRNMARTPYEMAKILILGGKYERSDMEYKLGKYLERKQITQAQYDELIALMEANELVV